jgi:predicted ATP-binding protein involved in virulence
MKLVNVKIVGYKSINEIEFPINKYGLIKSYTTILLGKNETGKSNILDAMATPALVEGENIVDFFPFVMLKLSQNLYRYFSLLILKVLLMTITANILQK